MTDDAVLYRSSDGIAVVTLNRPDNRNSMTAELLEAFTGAVARARADAELRCVVITGTGSCFSAGADFKAEIPRGGSHLPHEPSFAIAVAIVLVCARFAGWLSGVLASILTAAFMAFFLLHPEYSFLVDNPVLARELWISSLIMLIFSVLVGYRPQHSWWGMLRRRPGH